MSDGFGRFVCAAGAAAAFALAGGCERPPEAVRVYRGSGGSVVLDPANGWNDIVVDGPPEALYWSSSEPVALILNLPARLEPGLEYPVYAGRPSMSPSERPEGQIGVSFSSQPDGPTSVSGTIRVDEWMPSSPAVLVALQVRSLRIVGPGGSAEGAYGDFTVGPTWMFRGALRSDGRSPDSEPAVMSTHIPAGLPGAP